MLANSSFRAVSLLRTSMRRNFGASAVALQKASDPIQQLFVDKVREYAQKKKSAGGKLVDSSPAVEAELQKELEKVAKQFGGRAGENMTAFPELKFEEPKVEDIDLK